jgi:hypothetical protein
VAAASVDAHMVSEDAQMASAAVAAHSMTAVPLAAASLAAFYGSCTFSNGKGVTDTFLFCPSNGSNVTDTIFS